METITGEALLPEHVILTIVYEPATGRVNLGLLHGTMRHAVVALTQSLHQITQIEDRRI